MKIAALFAIAAVVAPGLARAQTPSNIWQAYSYGSEPNDVALIYGARLDGGQPYYPGLTCPNRGQIVVHFYLSDRYFPNHRSDGAMTDARGLAGPWHTTVRVTAGAASANLPGTIEYDDIGDVIEVRATLPHGSAVARQVLRTGRFQASANGYTTRFSPIPAGLRAQLSAYCTGR